MFCSRCGSPLFKRTRGVDGVADQVRLRLGCLDAPVEITPACHVHVDEKPEWSEICDALPQFAKAYEAAR